MLPLSFRFSSLVVLGALAAAACENISLSGSNAANVPAPAGFADVDASAEAGGPAASLVAMDGGVAPAVTGNPLCNYGFANSTGHTCMPDIPDDADGGQQQCLLTTPPDAGAAVRPANPSDGGTSNGGSGDDGGVGATPPSDAGTDASTPACRVVQDGTDDGGTWTTQQCTAVGTGTDGDQCEKSTDCAAAYECVGTPGQCRHYCCGGNTVCDATYAPSFCDVQPVVSGKFDVPVCMPISGCSLFGACPADQTCAIVKDDGTTSCVEIGPAGVGAPCDETHCAAGLTCLGNDGARTCFQLCHIDSPTDCPAATTCAGSAQLFKDPQFGICQ